MSERGGFIIWFPTRTCALSRSTLEFALLVPSEGQSLFLWEGDPDPQQFGSHTSSSSAVSGSRELAL